MPARNSRTRTTPAPELREQAGDDPAADPVAGLFGDDSQGASDGDSGDTRERVGTDSGRTHNAVATPLADGLAAVRESVRESPPDSAASRPRVGCESPASRPRQRRESLATPPATASRVGPRERPRGPAGVPPRIEGESVFEYLQRPGVREHVRKVTLVHQRLGEDGRVTKGLPIIFGYAPSIAEVLEQVKEPGRYEVYAFATGASAFITTEKSFFIADHDLEGHRAQRASIAAPAGAPPPSRNGERLVFEGLVAELRQEVREARLAREADRERHERAEQELREQLADARASQQPARNELVDVVTALAGSGSLDLARAEKIRAEAFALGHEAGAREGKYEAFAQARERAAAELDEAAQVAALGLLGLASTNISAEQLAEVGQLGINLARIARNARGLFHRLRRLPIARPLVNAARTAVSNLVRARTNVQRIASRSQKVNTQSRQIQARLRALEARLARQATVPANVRAALSQAQRRLNAGLAKLGRERQQLKSLFASERKRLADARKAASQTVRAAKTEASKAVRTEGARVQLARVMKENGFLRGNVMLLSKDEFSRQVRELAEAREAKKKLEALARTLAMQRKRDAAKLSNLKLLMVKLKARLRRIEATASKAVTERRVDQQVEREKKQLVDRLQQLKDSFRQELFRVKNLTDEAVQKAGDVVNKSGIELMFRFLQRMTQGMRDIRDVTDAGEFLRLFPQVLEQLKLAQEIASPEKPEVTVTVPPQPAPVINVQPPSFRLSPNFEIKPPDVRIQEGDITVQVQPGQTKRVPAGTRQPV